MRSGSAACGIFLLGAAALLECGCGSKVAPERDDHDAGPHATKPPNIVVILADDLGFGDMGAYGARFGTQPPAPTPRMDELAAEGMLFTQAHSSNGVCSPSRYALLTAKYNWRTFSDVRV